MKNKFEEIMSQHSDKELIKILDSQKGDYQPEAMEAAQNEAKKRNISFYSEELKDEEINNREYKKSDSGLSSEEKEKIFEEEKFRFEVQYKLKKGAKSKNKNETIYGVLFIIGLILFVVLINGVFKTDEKTVHQESSYNSTKEPINLDDPVIFNDVQIYKFISKKITLQIITLT